jgi:hypothetical protein
VDNLKQDHIAYSGGGSNPIMSLYKYFDKKVLVVTMWLDSGYYDVSVSHFDSNEAIHDCEPNRAYGESKQRRSYTGTATPKKYHKIVEGCVQEIKDNEHLHVMFSLNNIEYALIEDEKIVKSRKIGEKTI